MATKTFKTRTNINSQFGWIANLRASVTVIPGPTALQVGYRRLGDLSAVLGQAPRTAASPRWVASWNNKTLIKSSEIQFRSVSFWSARKCRARRTNRSQERGLATRHRYDRRAFGDAYSRIIAGGSEHGDAAARTAA